MRERNMYSIDVIGRHRRPEANEPKRERAPLREHTPSTMRLSAPVSLAVSPYSGEVLNA